MNQINTFDVKQPDGQNQEDHAIHLFFKSSQFNNYKNEQKTWKRHFSKEVALMANKQMRRSSTSLVAREEQIKTMMRYNLIPLKAHRIFVVVCGIQFTDQGWNPNPLHLEHSILTHGPLGKSP